MADAQAESVRPGAGGRRRVPGRQRGREGPVYGAIDLGTNNCRLLVARPSDDGFRVVDAFSRIVRLGEGVGQSGQLSPAAVERTIAALKVCATKLRRNRVTRARCVATAACRLASNCEDFLARVVAETGIELEIISSGEEARLSVAGCTSLLDEDARFALVFDIGGGSTELTWVRNAPEMAPDVMGWTSLPFGVVSLAETYGGRDVSGEAYRTMVDLVRAELRPFEADHNLASLVAQGAVQMLGTSGTVTTLAGIHLDLARYDRRQVDGLWMHFDDTAEITGRLLEMTYGQRSAHPCIGRERADLVVAGCAILEGICSTWPVGRLRVGDRGVREGVLLSLMYADRAGSSAV